MHQEMRVALNSGTVADIVGGGSRGVVMADGTDSVLSVGRLLAQHEVLSVPVRGRRAFFDVHDLLAVVLRGDDPATLTVAQAANASHTDVYLPVTPSTGLYSLAELFSRGIHRAPVVDSSDSPDASVVAVVSQSLLLAHLAHRMGPDESELDLSLHHAGLAHRTDPPVFATPSDSLRDTLKLLGQHGYDAVAVVDPNSKLLSTLAVSSLRGLDFPALQKMLQGTVAEFLEVRPSEAGKSITAQSETSVRSLVLAMAQSGAHRAWIVDDNKLVGVVTLGDLIRYAMKVAGHAHDRRADFHVPK